MLSTAGFGPDRPVFPSGDESSETSSCIVRRKCPFVTIANSNQHGRDSEFRSHGRLGRGFDDDLQKTSSHGMQDMPQTKGPMRCLLSASWGPVLVL